MYRIGVIIIRLIVALIVWAFAVGISYGVINYFYPTGKDGINSVASLVIGVIAAISVWREVSSNDAEDIPSSVSESHQATASPSGGDTAEESLESESHQATASSSKKDTTGGCTDNDPSFEKPSEETDKDIENGDTGIPSSYSVYWGATYNWNAELIVHEDMLEIISSKHDEEKIIPSSSINSIMKVDNSIKIGEVSSDEQIVNTVLKFDSKNKLKNAKKDLSKMISSNFKSKSEKKESKPEKIERYYELMKEGAISEKEYEMKKRDILDE